MVRLIRERYDAMFEMATLRKAKSGLPVNLYLDDCGSYLNGGHGPRIKFQTNKSDSPNTRTMLPMTISDTPEIPLKDYSRQLSDVRESDIMKIKMFVVNNKENLLRLCDKEDSYDITDFIRDMKKA